MSSNRRAKHERLIVCVSIQMQWICNQNMMTSSNGNIFRVTGQLCGEFPAKGQWRGALMFSLICVWINDWVNNREAGDLRRYRTHYNVIVMKCQKSLVAGALRRQMLRSQAPLTPSNWGALYRGRGSPIMSWIFLKANNAQQSSGGWAGFNVRLKSYLVLIFNFNSTNE